ncbi:MAG: hypothetical protein MZV70_55265 [Desulfobacterales bacterium]|nr:hypothetical protein [Desulfobacterales bacterium]
MDISGLNDLAAEITPDGKTGGPEKLQTFVNSLSLQKDTQPVSDVRFTISPLTKWNMKHPSGDKLMLEKITFPSLIRHPKRIGYGDFLCLQNGRTQRQKSDSLGSRRRGFRLCFPFY